MSNPGTDVVPFGKHKGKPVEVMLADPGYKEWLLGQPWFRERYPTFHQTIINIGGEPAETPEHNQMQAAFLDDGRCLALAKLLLPADLFNANAATRVLRSTQAGYSTTAPTDADRYEQFKEHLTAQLAEPRIHGRKFEADGWDVVFGVRPTALWLGVTSLPDCPCECDHERDCPGRATCRGGTDEYGCRHRHSEPRFVPTFEWWQNASDDERDETRRAMYAYHSGAHCNKDCPWHDTDDGKWLLDDSRRWYFPDGRTIHVECKPDLGDDFPAVLRQVTRYETGGIRDRVCVLVRRHSFEQVTWEQVTEIFQASGITLISEALINSDEEG